MKKQEWNEGLNRLDLEIIEKYTFKKDALNQKRKSAKLWLRVGIVAACVALVISVIATVVLLQGDETGQDVPAEPNSKESENYEPTEKEKGEVVYTIYADYSANDTPSGNDSKIPIKSSSEKVFSTAERTNIEKGEDVADVFEFKIQSRRYRADYFDSQALTLYSPDKLNQFNPIHTYMREGINVEIDTKGNVRFFSDSECDRTVNGDLTEAEAIENAKAVIVELYGKETADQYEHYMTFLDDESEYRRDYTISFMRKVFGFETGDTISVSFNLRGDLYSVNAMTMGTMATAEKDLTKEEIDNAIKAFTDNFKNGEGWSYTAPNTLLMDSNGDYYLRGSASMASDIAPIAMQLYINVQ